MKNCTLCEFFQSRKNCNLYWLAGLTVIRWEWWGVIKLCFYLKCACTRMRQRDVEFTDMTTLELRYVASGKLASRVRRTPANKSATWATWVLVLAKRFFSWYEINHQLLIIIIYILFANCQTVYYFFYSLLFWNTAVSETITNIDYTEWD